MKPRHRRGSSPAVFIWGFWAHRRWLHHEWKPGRVWGPVAYALSLGAGEVGLSLLAYLVIDTWGERTLSWRRRVRDLLPFVAITGVYLAIYRLGGYGSDGGEMYISPFADPVAFVQAVVLRGPVLMLARITGLPAEVGMVLSVLDPGAAIVLAGVAAIVVTVAMLLVMSLVPANAPMRALVWGMLLGLVPVCGAPPQDRVLLVVGIGASPLLAWVRVAGYRHTRRVVRGVARFVLGMHVVFPLVAYPLRTAAWHLFVRAVDIPALSLDRTEFRRDVTFVFVTSPGALTTLLIPPARAQMGLVPPGRIVSLGSTHDAVTVTRVGERELRLETTGTFATTFEDRIVRRRTHRFEAGQRFSIELGTVLVDAVDAAGHPTHLRVVFDDTVGVDEFVYMYWTDDGFVPFALPAVGTAVELAATHPLPPGPDRAWTFEVPPPHLL